MTNFDFLRLDLPEDVNKYLYIGDFDAAKKQIELYLARNLTEKLKERLKYQLEIIRRLEKEYIYNFRETLEIFDKNVEGFSKKELDFLKDERYMDWIFIDGEMMFHQKAFENTAKVHPGIRKRLKETYPGLKNEEFNRQVVEEIMKEGQAAYHIHIKKGLKLKDQYFQPMKTIHAHLPYPIKGGNMSNIVFERSSSKPSFIAAEDQSQRTIYFKEELNYNIPFEVEYSFDSSVDYVELDYEKVSKDQPSFFTEEFPPQISFTPYLKDLAYSLTEGIDNPLEKARKFYDYITQNVQYSFVRNYGAIDNIPEYAAYNLKGDCGVQALLFINLCRIVGIPSKWQSGLVTNPYHIGPHDWAQFYIAPYGWLYADLSFGGNNLRYGYPDIWNFYFGNIDPFRIVFNSDIQGDFDPAKKFLRDDPYDNQNGELEYDDRPIFSDEYDVISQIIQIKKIK